MLVCIYVGAVLGLADSASNGGLGFLGPDCNGVAVSVAGKVQNAANEPIEDAIVLIKYVAIDNSKKFNFTANTDKDGEFSYKKDLSIFVCDNLDFDISAKGFKDKSVQYSLFDDHSENEISTTAVNKINITITLERAS
jgi:hypothetical protein